MEWKDLPQQVVFALQSLEKAGFEAALVGGCVRDRLMGRAPGDYDITTSATPEETLRVFEDERTVPTGIQHGTVMVIYQGMAMEITSFREDGEYSDMRRPDSVRFTRSLREDVMRRDFTMNALAWEPGRGVIDHTGGMQDIRNGVIRAVGEPERRFTEDALRILRAVRFSAQLGFSIEEQTDRAVRALHGNIDRIAAERVRVEMEKTLLGQNAADTLRKYRDILRARLLCGDSIADEQWDEAAQRLQALKEAVPEAGGVLCWAALLMSAGADRAAQSLLALRSDKATVHGVQSRLVIAAAPLDTLYTLRCAVGDHGAGAVRDAVQLRYAFDMATKARALDLLGQIASQNLPCTMAELAVGGADLMRLGARGKQVGSILHALIDGVRAGRIANDRAALLKSAQRAIITNDKAE